MKRRLVVSFLGVTASVLILLAVPFGYLLRRTATDETSQQLDLQAQMLATIAGTVTTDAPIQAHRLDQYLPPDSWATVHFPDGTREDIGEQSEAPFLKGSGTDTTTGASVTLFTDASQVRERVRTPLMVLGGLGVAGLLTTWLLAQAEARRLRQPISDLAAAASRLGSGDFSVTAPRSGIPELDSLATTLDASAARIAALVRAERSFASDAGHQLRSALTGLRLRLEEAALTEDAHAREEVAAAIGQADRLSTTIDDLLKLSRTGRAGVATRFDLRGLVDGHVGDVAGTLRLRRRRIRVIDGPPVYAVAAQGAVGQALDVMLWNAARHGRGDVTVALDVTEGWVELTVADEGSITTDRAEEIFVQTQRGGGHGIGLPLARRVVEAEGGRLDLVSLDPTTFRVRLQLSE
ncbi:MAG: HAMP domain-containing sensor histidine kinase [Microthrixaceae bacterium]